MEWFTYFRCTVS